MITTLRYGRGGHITLDVPQERLIGACGLPDAAPLADVAGAAAEAIQSPLGYPPLAKLVVPGDKVCLALDEGVPRAAEVVRAIVDGLAEGGIEPQDITLIRGAAAASHDPLGVWTQTMSAALGDVQIVTHDPTDRKRLSYLAASAEGKPIYLDRALADADLVIPIGTLRLDSSLAYFGVGSTVFPTFSDAASIERYRAPLPAHAPVQLRRRRAEADQVTWLLGIQFVVEVLPAGDDAALAVLAGQVDEVARVGHQRCRAAWQRSVRERASLVIAALTGPPEEQTWLNVARAMASALRIADEGGTIAICTELDEPPGPALRYLAATESPAEALREIVRHRPDDALAAAELVEASNHGRVYLLSNLAAAAIEDLGLTPIDEPEQLQRLVAQHPNCLLLANAQYSLATAEGEEEVASTTRVERPRSRRK